MIESLKRIGRLGLRLYCGSNLRGRSRAMEWFSPWLAPRGAVEMVRIGGHSILLDHRVRAMRMMAYGIYERAECEYLYGLVPRGGVVFDVGANVGYLTAWFAEAVGPGGHVYAFEPSAMCGPVLQGVADSSDWKNITVISAAVAESSRRGNYFETEKILSHGFGRIDVRPGSQHKQITEHDVRIVSLDDYFEAAALERLDFVKIDVEGAERQCIEGMRRMFARGLHPKILIELTGAEPYREEAVAISEALAHYGYRCFLITNPIVPLAIHELPRGFHANVLFLPPDERAIE